MRQWHQGKEGFMKVTRIQDKYNPDKVWMIKRYLCGTFYVNQEIKGQKFYDRDRRMTTETGKVQERISKDSVTRMRRKLKKFRKLMDAGEMSFDDVRCAYASWKGGVSHYDSYNVVKSMDKLFDELFIHPFIEGGHRDEQNNNEQK